MTVNCGTGVSAAEYLAKGKALTSLAGPEPPHSGAGLCARRSGEVQALAWRPDWLATGSRRNARASGSSAEDLKNSAQYQSGEARGTP